MSTARLSKTAYCTLLIALCFFWTSSAFLSWLYRVMEFLDAVRTDLLCEVLAYLLQAAGIGLFALAVVRRPGLAGCGGFAAASSLDLVCAALSIWSGRFWSVAVFGLAMNVLHGFLAGFYLRVLASLVRGLSATVFGCGYGLAVIAAWALSLAGSGNFLHTPYVLLVYTAAAVGTVWLALSRREDAPAAEAEAAPEALTRGALLLFSAAVLSMSLVKNMGFSFPAADIQTGTSLELTRIFYAAGLALAGRLLDRKRQLGYFACAVALILPFVLLVLSRETVSSAALWSADYFFYGFFSAFRVILFADLAIRSGRYWLSGFGLLFGRVGDALGTALCIALQGDPVILVLLTGALFIVTAALLFALYQRSAVSSPAAAALSGLSPEPEADPLERFAAQAGLSRRERDVLRLLLARRSNPEIAEALNVSENTVKFHVRNVLQKTGCKNRKELLEKLGAG